MEDKVYKHLISSAVATCIAEIATLPICTLKTTYQNTDKSTTIINTFKHMLKTNGIKGFYNASFWAMSSQILSTSSKYTLYRRIEKEMPNKFVAGATTGVISTLLTHPFDAIKIHFQMQTSFFQELKKHGVKLFYRGYSKTLTKGIIGTSLYLPLFDTINNKLQNDHTNHNSFKTTVAAMITGIVSTTLVHPIDYMKTRQVYGLKHFHRFTDFKNYFKGLSLNLMRVVPHFAITMTFIEIISKKLIISS